MNRLKEIRKSMKLSQEQMAALLHLSRKTYGTYERGEKQPGPAGRRALAEFLRMSPEQIWSDSAPLPSIPRDAGEEELLKIYRRLDPAGREYVYQTMLNEESLSELYQDLRSPFGR